MKQIILKVNVIISCFFCTQVKSQQSKDSVLQQATLSACIQYAIKHQPVIQQSLLDEVITEKTIQTKLADWYPQLNFNYNLQHNFQLPTAYFNGNYIPTGTFNTSNVGLGLTQNIFNKDILLASKTANIVRSQSKQNTTSNLIDVAATVSKAFYDVLLTQKQVAVLDESIIRLQRSLKDAFSQYQAGIVDKTDYKRATISLNNAKAQRKQTNSLINAKYEYLKQLMGYPDSATLVLQYDSSIMEKEALIDTLQMINYNNRIEFQQIQTQKKLQQANLKYYKWSYLPTISAFGNYNIGFLDNNFLKTYSQSFPNSNIGIQLSLPIFQGNKRVNQIKLAELQVKRLDWDEVLLRNKINTQYAQALAIYKGNLANYQSLKENVLLADEVYKTIRLQYTSGIKTYLDVIIAEADLNTAQINFYNSLYQLLESKVDVEKSLGIINY
ncbi:MAG: TolC family protein [Bacteroidetes bacterium]|nr:TolC family protein [Bacteroidota bacterium]MBS1649503.1 TolC family protein [Bacteroidota bacterium]